MGVNKDKNFKLSENAEKFQMERIKNDSKHDLALYEQMINEVNSKGYYIKYIGQLSFIDKDDLVLVPIIQKYCKLFDDIRTERALLSYLGFKGNTVSIDFLIDEFKKPNDYWDRNDPNTWNFTRRWAISNAINIINDKTKEDDYIGFIKDPETRHDSMFIIEMLGRMKSEKAYPYLVKFLNDDDSSVVYHSIIALGYYKNHPELIPLIEPFLDSNHKPHVEEAKKALKKLNKHK